MSLLKEMIDSLVESEFLTKGNSPITFNIIENDENLGRGWVVHKIEALVDGVPAGYIKISFIPKENMDREFPTIIQYIDKMEGKNLMLPKSSIPGKTHRSDGFGALTLPEQALCLDALNDYRLSERNLPEYQAKTPQELKQIIKRSMKFIDQRFGDGYRRFRAFHTDKPLVDFIRVDDNFRRQRVGIALYSKAAMWLSSKGLKLYASGIQSDEAKASWNWIRANLGAQVGTEPSAYDGKTRTFLTF